MTLNTKHVVVATVAAAALALGVTAGLRASAQNTSQDPRSFSGHGMGPGGRGGMLGPGGLGSPLAMLRMLGPQLNLTDAQKEQIKNIADAHRDEWKALGDRERLAHEALTAAIMADTIDEALIRSKSAELGIVQADAAVASARARAEVWQILTPDQQAQAKKLQANFSARRQSFQRGRGRH
jgi:Spy/CpxP family protein refolding chaperone